MDSYNDITVLSRVHFTAHEGFLYTNNKNTYI